MNRLNPPQSIRQKMQKVLGWSPKVHYPTPREMGEFAHQFTRDEWGRLCESTSFLEAMTRDLRQAGALADAVLKRHVIVFT